MGLPSNPRARRYSRTMPYLRACSRQAARSLQYVRGFSITMQIYNFLRKRARKIEANEATETKKFEGGDALYYYYKSKDDC